MNYEDLDDVVNPELFDQGKAFGEKSLQRICDRLKELPCSEVDDMGDFLYPALAVEVLGVVNLIRQGTDRETAAAWFSEFLQFVSDCMSKNPMKSRIESTAVVDAEEPEGESFY